MLQDGIRHFTNIPLVVGGMLIFISVFVGVLIQLARDPSRFHEAAQLPLSEEIHNE